MWGSAENSVIVHENLPPAEQIFLFVKIKTKPKFCPLRAKNDKLSLWNTHRLVLISTHCTDVVSHDCWLTVPKTLRLTRQQLTENLLLVPLLWQFSSTCPFRRLVPGPVWVVSKIIIFCFVLLCCVFIFSPLFLNGRKSLSKECCRQKASNCRQSDWAYSTAFLPLKPGILKLDSKCRCFKNMPHF